MTDVADGVCAEDTWLVAVQGEVATPDVRLWWNCKETPDLDARIEQWPRIRLGTVLTGTKSKDPDTPARRVTALLFLRGTLPEDFTPVETDPYVFPLLTEDLRGGILSAYAPREHDAPRADPPDVTGLAEFLNRHLGTRLAYANLSPD